MIKEFQFLFCLSRYKVSLSFLVEVTAAVDLSVLNHFHFSSNHLKSEILFIILLIQNGNPKFLWLKYNDGALNEDIKQVNQHFHPNLRILLY